MSPVNSESHGIVDGSWSVDAERSEVGFAVKSVWGMSTVRGTFGSFKGNLSVQGDAASGELAIDAASVDTGNGRRDRHLSSPDFFDAEIHPWICVKLASATWRSPGLAAVGELRIRDTSTRIQLPIDVAHNRDGSLRLTCTASISRAAAGVAWNWLGVIGDETTVHAELSLIPA